MATTKTKEDRRTRSAERATPGATKSVQREYFEALLIAALFLGFTNTFLVKTFYIPSGSMEKTLLIGDHLFVNRYVFGPGGGGLLPARNVRRGDIVIFRSPKTPETDLVKRCIGLPGDEIQLVNKQLFINGQAVDDSTYTQRTGDPAATRGSFPRPQARVRDNFGPFTVPEEHYFFLGDNRDHSYDSRYWGAVPRHLIKGRALLIYWSFGGETPDGTWRGWGNKLAQIAKTATGFVTQSRWSRTFRLIR